MFIFEKASHGLEVLKAFWGEDCVDRDVVDRIDYEHELQKVEQRSTVIVVIEAAFFYTFIASGLISQLVFGKTLTR